jgi:hypothetical protein
MEIKRLLWKEKTSLIKEYIFYVQLNKKEIKDIARGIFRASEGLGGVH